MFYPGITQMEDYGLDGFGATGDNAEPEDWRKYGLPTWGAYADTMGVISGDTVPFTAQVDQALYGNKVLARTPQIELSPEDYDYVRAMRSAYDGMMGLGDDGTLYQYDGTLGFFRKLFRKAKKFVKKVGGKIKRGVKRVLKKIPGGKYLMKLGKRVYKIASKIVKPLVKYVGKYAAKLAPVAALIPGYGPAIAGALYSAGKIANLMQKYGAKIKGAAGKVRALDFPSGKSAKKFQKALKKAAANQRRAFQKMKRRKRAAIPGRYRRRSRPKVSPKMLAHRKRARMAAKRMLSRFKSRRRW
jgi:hypothetical protein